MDNTLIGSAMSDALWLIVVGVVVLVRRGERVPAVHAIVVR